MDDARSADGIASRCRLENDTRPGVDRLVLFGN